MNDLATIEITEKFLSSCATGTLLGTLAIDHDLSKIKNVVLVFPEATISWCRKNKGPHQYIVDEFTFRCLLDDVLRLQTRGITVTTKVVMRDPT